MFKFLTYLFLVFLNFSDAKAEDDKEVYKHPYPHLQKHKDLLK